MMIEVKQGARGRWRWIVRSDNGKALFLAPVRNAHHEPADAVWDARSALYRTMSGLLAGRWWTRLLLRESVINRMVSEVPHEVVRR